MNSYSCSWQMINYPASLVLAHSTKHLWNIFLLVNQTMDTKPARHNTTGVFRTRSTRFGFHYQQRRSWSNKKPGLIHDPSKTLLMFCIPYIILIYFKAIKLTSRAHDEGLPPMQTSKLGLINMNGTTLILRERENDYTNMLRILWN